MLDWIVTNATVVDGGGGDPYRAHVGIEGDRIAGPFRGAPPPAARTVDAGGKVLAPGFIDVHSHADLIHPLAASRRRELVGGRIAQGITTEIVGNCGLGAAPRPPAAGPVLDAIHAWMTPEGSEPGWNSFASYLEALESAAPSSNVGALAPHGVLRVAVMGLEAREPDASERARLSAELEAALDAGAFGLSSGLIYPPGMYAASGELVELARAVARRGRIYCSHIRGSSETLLEAVDELLQLGRASACAVHHSHSEAVGPEHWPKLDRVLLREEAAAREGVAISFDMFPYTAAATMMLAIYPPWALAGGVERLLERLADAPTRRRIARDVAERAPRWPPWQPGEWPHNLVRACGWENVRIASASRPESRRFEMRSLVELGEEMGTTPFDAVSDLMAADGGGLGQLLFGISGPPDEDGAPAENLAKLAAHPLGIVATDANDYGRGRPHPAAYGAFARILARFARDRGVLSLAEAVAKLTARPAALFGIAGRGLVRERCFADLVLFDYDRVADRATYAEPRRAASGFEAVWINGRLVLQRGEWRDEHAGRVLRPGAS